jgi:hypothetical protein
MRISFWTGNALAVKILRLDWTLSPKMLALRDHAELDKGSQEIYELI